MNVSDLIDTMAFSHRPQDGISVGVIVIAGVAYMAVGFVRDGDQFNRKLARHILAQRVLSTVQENKNVKFVAVAENLPEKADSRAMIREFRKMFKPDPTCNDATFVTVGSFGFVTVGSCGNVTTRSPMPRDQQWTKIVGMFSTAVQTVNTQCVS